MKKLKLSLLLLCSALFTSVLFGQEEIIHDAEFYILEYQNEEEWNKEPISLYFFSYYA